MDHAHDIIHPVEDSFARDVLAGLSADVKTLPSRWLYDERGSALFEEITRLDEYYLTRAETSILRERQNDIADFVESGAILIEYGAGAGVKTELVLAGLREPRGYVPIDIADTFLAETSKRIALRFPSLWVRPIERNFLDVFKVPFDESDGGRTGFFPGSTMGNLNASEAKTLLTQMGQHLGDDGRAIIGVDLQKNVGTLLRAYDDSAGVTAAFNLNLLERINAELGGDFRLEQFEHAARWNEIEKAVEMHLVSLCDQRVTICGRTFDFRTSETIHTESSRKYTAESFERLARSGGWRVAEAWQDADRLFGLFGLIRG
ncbi:L-histidine N(alpha)-methyltransferase [Bradyrhizobium tropiciagri]|uniref:L-histidine N(alpha)-methyltransferase n=1 Tax=Bradyrhizobium tropiciagri TaxID=312253 RepID=UPI001BA6B540|nr:L-histidine N(alpha)-methyltransferase [Bradyrhizobium tropiciagri]MBR0873257.1 L-histidine N(alpha)-methyltransferase [Bradyrhizobium tropiciagri]